MCGIICRVFPGSLEVAFLVVKAAAVAYLTISSVMIWFTHEHGLSLERVSPARRPETPAGVAALAVTV